MFTLKQYVPKVVGHDKAIAGVMSTVYKFIEKENEKAGVFTEEVDINDYPQMVRAKVQSRDFLISMGEMSGSKV
jgi:hypothetical protein